MVHMDRPFAFFTVYFHSQLKVELTFFPPFTTCSNMKLSFFCFLSKQGVATCCVHGPWQEQHSWWVSLRSLQTPSYWPETGKSNAGKINSSNHNMYTMWRPSFTIFCSDAYHFCNFSGSTSQWNSRTQQFKFKRRRTCRQTSASQKAKIWPKNAKRVVISRGGHYCKRR